VQTERDERRARIGAVDAEDPAFLMQLVVVKWVGRQHGGGIRCEQQLARI